MVRGTVKSFLFTHVFTDFYSKCGSVQCGCEIIVPESRDIRFEGDKSFYTRIPRQNQTVFHKVLYTRTEVYNVVRMK